MRAVVCGLMVVTAAVAGCAPPVVREVAVVPQAHVPSPPCILKYPDLRASRAARARLQHDVARYVARQPGRVVFGAHDLATGLRLGHHAHERGMITASGSKVDILAALLLRRHRLTGGERDLATRMIRESDNAAADALWSRVGGGYGMGGFYRRAGLRETVPGPSQFWGGTNTSPADRLRLLRLLAEGGGGLRAAERRLVLGLMERVQRDQAWGVSAAARPGDRVALKNGWTPRPFMHNTWAVTSYGRITGPGRDLLLAVQTDYQPGEGRGIQAIEGLSDLVGRRLADLRQVTVRACPAAPAL
jgi:hypothetical protein